MAAAAPATQQQGSILQQQAIVQARLAFSKVPKGDAVFQACIQQKESLVEVVKTVLKETKVHKKKTSSQLLDKFQRYTLWLQNIGDVVDVAVQAQAGIACPIWAPVKFVLKVSCNHSQAVEQVLCLVETISVCLPRFEIYERLQTDNALQAALLDVFTDIVDYSVCAIRFLKRSTLAKLSKSIGRSFDRELQEIVRRVERHSLAVDHIAVATELLRASQYRILDSLNHKKEMKLNCERWLGPANIKEIHERQVFQRSSRTCTWIIHDERYKRWERLESSAISDRFLCISGTNGCGKSVLSSYIVERLEQQQFSTLHFAFSSTGTCQRTVADMTRTLAWQLLHKSVDEPNVYIVQDLMSRGQLVASDLWEVLGSMLGLSPTPVFCILDGVDECNDFDRTVVERLFSILQARSTLHLVLLGRPPAIQNLSLASTFTVSVIEITATTVSGDIETYIEDEIASSQLFNDLESRTKISQILHEKSDGMFLWVRLTIDDLRKAATKSELMERIDKLPRGLEDIYRSILSRLTQELDNFELRLAQNILGFTTVCCRPLTYDQLRYAHALDLRSRCCSGTPRATDEFLVVHPIQRITNLCGGLIFEANGVVRLIHSSVRDFLARPADQWSSRVDSELSNFRVNEMAYHGVFSNICLDYLNTAWDIECLMETGGLEVVHTVHPFLKYAALHAVYHLNRVGRLSPTILGKLRTLLEALQNGSWVAYFVSILLDNASLEVLETMLDEYMSLEVSIGRRIDMDLMSAFYKCVVQELITRTRNLGPGHYLSAQWQWLLEFAKDFTHSDVYRDIKDEHAVQPAETEFQATGSLKPSRPQLSSSRLGLDPSQMVGLINSCIGKPSSRRIEIYFELSMLLQRSRKLTDPLERLLQLVLAKASCIPIVALEGIALFYLRLSKFETALQFYDAALSKIDGQNTAIEFRLHDDIGSCFKSLGDYKKALRHYEIAHTGMESLFGKDHVEAFESLAAKRHCLCLLQRYGDCLECDLLLVARSRAIHGDNHKETLTARNWEAESLYNLQRYDEALTCFQELLVANKVVHGENDKVTLESMHWLGCTLYELRRYEEAVLNFQELVVANRLVFGKNDKVTLHAMHWLGYTLYELRRYEEAFLNFQELVIADKVVRGENDKLTLDSMYWLGRTLYELRRYEEAVLKFQRLVVADKVVRGGNDKDTLASMYWLGRTFYELRRYEEAFLNFQELVVANRLVCGENDKVTLRSVYWLGRALYKLGRHEEALLNFQESAVANRLAYGENGEVTLASMYRVDRTLYKLGRHEEVSECSDSSVGEDSSVGDLVC